ncbi:MAG: peptide deformylase [Microgenomates group bacterium]
MHILTTPHPFLKHIAKAVTSWDKKTAREVKEMGEILKKTTDPKGVGLAATQVGLDKRIFILLSEEKVQVFVNPEIVSASKKMLSSVYKKKKDRWLEGCLSIPRLWGFVDRHYSISLKYQEADTLRTVTQDFIDVAAAYIQHEVDHLNGILFTDRIRQQKGQILRETEDGLTPISL